MGAMDALAKLMTKDFLKLIQKERRGKLKIYLGFAAGVGKTYRMLTEGHELREQRLDIVIGYVESHDRPDTVAKTKDFEVIPLLSVFYKGRMFKEMDIDAILYRQPAIALIDELAHTNVPGSRNQKRYQDMEELLMAGVNVITTLNIQHLESLCDVGIIERITGIKVSERIPDSIVRNADMIINVDLEVEELIERLKSGKIFELDIVDQALENFFTYRNLSYLREIALSKTADMFNDRYHLDYWMR